MQQQILSKIYTIFWLVIVISSSNCIAQVTNYAQYGNAIPSTAEVASIKKFVDQAVGYSGGTPSIAIPAYTAKDGALEAAVSLQYNASGIKVEESATWVGLGWNLSTGASLSRVVNGLPDDLAGIGYMYTHLTVAAIRSIPKLTDSPDSIDSYLADNHLDTEPDSYIYSIGEFSGRFYYNQRTKDFVLAPKHNLKISAVKSAGGEIKGFVITLPNAVKYFFGLSKNGSRQACERQMNALTTNVATNTTIAPPQADAPQHISNWCLMEIENDVGNKIEYFYDQYTMVEFGRAGEYIDLIGNVVCGVPGNLLTSTFY